MKKPEEKVKRYAKDKHCLGFECGASWCKFEIGDGGAWSDTYGTVPIRDPNQAREIAAFWLRAAELLEGSMT